jgi:dihydroorotase
MKFLQAHLMTKGSVLISVATMALPSGLIHGDLRIVNGVITEISTTAGSLVVKPEERFIAADGFHLLPGIIDPQVHFREPGQPEKEDLQSGSAAAASGGVTSFLDMPNNKPSAVTLESIMDKITTAGNKCITHHGFFIGATPTNVSELQKAVGKPDMGISIPGICGIKIFMGASTGDLLVNELHHLDNIFSSTAGLIAVHAEDEKRMIERFETFKHRTDMAAHAEWRDDICALNATKTAVNLALKHQHRLHVLHLTSAIEADWLSEKIDSSGLISTETLPQHLTFAEEEVMEVGTRLKMNPPIRSTEDRRVLWQRLLDGTIACIATDHAPHTLEGKTLGWPNAPSGMPGVETSLPVMLTHARDGKCTIEQVVNWMSTNVAQTYQMVGKGKLEEGMDGDVVLVDMSAEIIVKDENSWSKVGWNPFAGQNLVGWPVLTIVDGVSVFERNSETGPRGEILVEAGEVGRPLIMMPWN